MVLANTAIRRVDFGILNFRGFNGDGDKYVTRRGASHRLGSTEVRYRGFGLKITEHLSQWNETKRWKSTNGYAVTHDGVLQRSDRKSYSVAEAEEILRRLRAFLSFLRGAACGLAPVRAVVADGRKTVFRWGTTNVDTGRLGDDTWLLPVDGGAVIAGLLPEFDRLCDDPNWGEGLFAVVDWYINANNSAAHVALVLAQAALEAPQS